MKPVELESLVGKTVHYSYWVNRKLIFVLDDGEILMNVFREHYDTAVKNGKAYRYERVKKFTIKEIAWARSTTTLTSLMIVTDEDDIYHFYCDFDLFGPITKLYHYDKYQKYSKRYYSRID